MVFISKDELFERVRKANGLTGRQKITVCWSDTYDSWVFDSNAKGGYGETLTFRYHTDSDLLKDIAPECVMIYYGEDEHGKRGFVLA